MRTSCGTRAVGGRPAWVVSFANPTTPAWFTAVIDRATYRPLRLHMTAAAHFMTHRYLEFDRPLTDRAAAMMFLVVLRRSGPQ